MLIHGVPGAGKTALLYELEKLAVTSGWETSKNMFYPRLFGPQASYAQLSARTSDLKFPSQ